MQIYYAQIGSVFEIKNEKYRIKGYIEFKNDSDGCTWKEYRLESVSNKKTFWLSVDDIYKEYALYWTERYSNDSFSDEGIANQGYKKVDEYKGKVISYGGNVDVEKYDVVKATEYEDETEEKIISIESWEDETEYSRGYYLDLDEIQLKADDQTPNSSYSTNKQSSNLNGKTKIKRILIIVAIIYLVIGVLQVIILVASSDKAIQKYIDKSSKYTYETSITSTYNDKEKAKVYKSNMTVSSTITDIIDGINGESSDISVSDDEQSAVILTKKEYCLIYVSEDESTFVQVSSRLYTYTSDSDPYRSRIATRNFYRGYYRNKVYSTDKSTYSSYSSPYTDTSTATYDYSTNSYSSSTYNSYSSSVRQSATSSRSSSGGGTHSGK